MISKTIKSTLALLAFLPLTLSAQMKFGHIDKADLLSKMPKVIEVQKTLEASGTKAEADLKEMSDEYDKKLADYQSATTMSDAMRKNKEADIMQTQQRIQDFQQNAKDELDKQQEQLLSPILKEFEDAVKAVAKEGSFTYIFDTSPGSPVLFAMDSLDIAPLVKKKLGLQ